MASLNAARFHLPTLFLLSFLLVFAPALRAEDAAPKPEERAQAALKQIQAAPLDAIWEPVNTLVRAGVESGAPVEKLVEAQLKRGDEKMQIACARALVRIKSAEAGLPTLLKLAAGGSTPEIRRVAAQTLRVVPIADDDIATPAALKKALAKEADPLARIAVARALWRISGDPDSRNYLKDLLKTANKPVRDEAVLALAEMGSLVPRDEIPKPEQATPEDMISLEVYARILELSLEPTPTGERALALYRQVRENAGNEDPKIAKGERLMREILSYIKQAYPDESKYKPDDLFEGAARGLAGGLDPFSQYLDREETANTQEMLNQQYGGIGAIVGVRDRLFTIMCPIYGSPADRAGMRSLDWITEIDGVKCGDMIDKGATRDLLSKLKGDPGSKIHIKFTRRGFLKPVDVDLTRETIRIDSVLYTMLPGQIGYIRLTRFGERSAEEVKHAMEDLFQVQKAKGLVFDLRDNPGGLFSSAIKIAELFLEKNKLIVFSEGRIDFSPRREFYSNDVFHPDAEGKAGPEDYPVTVLINSGSASASEIVSGCLQDQKRATLVGERSYGKGSVQQIVPLRATKGQTQLRITVAKYFLPSGRCIHEKGIDPEVVVHPPELDDSSMRLRVDLRQKHVLDDFVAARWAGAKDTFVKLTQDEAAKLEDYPDASELLKQADAMRLKPVELQEELRYVVRRMAQDDLKKEYPCDLVGDPVLQRGVFELLSKLDPQLADVPAPYKGLVERFKKTNAGLSALPVPEQGK